MTLEAELVTKLKADAGVTAIAGSRIYPFGEVPEGVSAPYVTYQLTSMNPIGTSFSGKSSFWKQSYQLDAWAPMGGSPSGTITAINLATAIRDALSGSALPTQASSIDWADWRDLPEEHWARREADYEFWTNDP